MHLTDFIIIGARKAASSSICRYLKQHPQLHMPPFKRLRFFNKWDKLGSKFDEKAISSFFDKYKHMCGRAQERQVIGEVGSGYLSCKRAAEMIKYYLPDVKLIAILRDPVDRAYSEYMMQLRDGYQKRGLMEMVERGNTYYLQASYYGRLLKKYYDIFGQEKIRIYIYEEFKKNPVKIFQDMLRFIGVDHSFVPNMTKRDQQGMTPKSKTFARLVGIKNPLRSFLANILKPFMSLDKRQKLRAKLQKANWEEAPPLSESDKDKLMQFFKDDIRRLEKLTGIDFSSVWLKKNK